MSLGPLMPFCGTLAFGSLIAVGISCAPFSLASEATLAAWPADAASSRTQTVLTLHSALDLKQLGLRSTEHSVLSQSLIDRDETCAGYGRRGALLHRPRGRQSAALIGQLHVHYTY